MHSNVFIRSDLDAIMQALQEACTGPAPYDHGRRDGIALVARALNIDLPEPRRGQRHPDLLDEAIDIAERVFTNRE